MTKTAWDTEQLFFEGDGYFAALTDDIHHAVSDIALQTYIFDLDSVGQPLLSALTLALDRKVRVRIILDGIGSANDAEKIVQVICQHGGEVHIYHPLPWQPSQHRQATPGKIVQNLLHFFRRLNRRQHSKLCVIDGNIAWVGSYNISGAHRSQSLGGSGWKDCGARVGGHSIKFLQTAFDAVWQQQAAPFGRRLSHRFIANTNARLRRKRWRELLTQIKQAESRIWITSAYFSPPGVFLRALKMAKSRGVDVKIIVPQKSDVIFFPALSSTYYTDLLRQGIEIFEYRPSMLHAKSMIIDDKAIIGSSNLNHRSLLHDIELDIILSRLSSIKQMQREFRNNLKNAEPITTALFEKRHFLIITIGWIPRLLRYWM